MQVRIVDEDGADVPNGNSGRFADPRRSQFPAISSARADPRGVDDDGWPTPVTGHDRRRRLRVVDRRAKDIVIRGENIRGRGGAALYQHHAVREVAIIGIPDERMGSAPARSSYPRWVLTHPGRPGRALDELGFAKQFWPERLELVEILPRTPAGKVQKFRLQQQLSARATAAMPSFVHRPTIRFFEADQQRVVYHMWYLAYFEDARNAMPPSAGCRCGLFTPRASTCRSSTTSSTGSAGPLRDDLVVAVEVRRSVRRALPFLTAVVARVRPSPVGRSMSSYGVVRADRAGPRGAAGGTATGAAA